MTKYTVNCSFNETFLVDADTQEDAMDCATMQMEDLYGLAFGQVKINSIKEI